ncbi:MAG: hypothetical protein ABIN13_17970, partial [Mucilaginibacter sp.]
NNFLSSDYKSNKEFSKSFKGYYTYKVKYAYELIEENPGMDDMKVKEAPELIEGPENDKLFEELHLQLPIIEIPVKFQVLYELTKVEAQHESVSIKNLSIDIGRGITVIKVKKGTVSFTRFPPLDNFQKLILDKVDAKLNGAYIVKYEFGNILADSVNNVTVTKVEPNKAN